MNIADVYAASASDQLTPFTGPCVNGRFPLKSATLLHSVGRI